MSRKRPPAEVETVFRREELLRNIMRSVQHCLQLGSRFMRWLGGATQCEEAEIMGQLRALHALKEDIEGAFRENEAILRSADGLFVYYLFLKAGRSRKYSLVDSLRSRFERLARDKSQEAIPVSRHLICLVSGLEESIGMLLNANRLMCETFGINPDRLQHKAFNVSEIMPRQVGVIHNNIMRQFKKSGVSRHIGRTRSLLAVRRERVLRLDTLVKICASNDGLVFAGSMILPKVHGQYALYDAFGTVTHCSSWVRDYFGWDRSPNVCKGSTPVPTPTAPMRAMADFPLSSKFALLDGCPIELYEEEFPTDCVGVCKFLEANTSANYMDFVTRQLRAVSSLNPAESLNSECAREDKRFHDLEGLISRSLPKLPGGTSPQWAALLACLATIAGLCWLDYRGAEGLQAIQASVAGDKLLFKTTLVESLEVLMGISMANGVYRSVFAEAAMAQYQIPVFSDYIRRGMAGLAAQTYGSSQTVLALAPQLPAEIVSLLLEKKFPEESLTSLWMDYFTATTFKLSMFSEVAGMSRAVFLGAWDRIYAKLAFLRSRLNLDEERTSNARKLQVVFELVRKFSREVSITANVILAIVLAMGLAYLSCLVQQLRHCRHFVGMLGFLE